MSDAVKMNQAISNYLKQILGGTVADSHILALGMMITGLIRSRSSNFDQIGRKSGWRGKSKFQSRVKLIHRFNKNKNVSYEKHFLPFIEVVMVSLGLKEYRLSIDSSKVGRNCTILVIGLVYKKRVIPLAWMIYKGSKGHSSAERQMRLYQQVLELLPQEAKVILTGDAEFDNVDSLSMLQSKPNWDFSLRTAKNIKLSFANAKDSEQYSLEELAPTLQEEKFLTAVYFTGQKVGPVNIAILWDKAKQEHFYLVTSAETLAQTQKWYKRRFSIETLFSDTKSRGFGLHKSGINEPKRLARFVIAVFLAYIWMIYLGSLVILDRHLSLITRTDRFVSSIVQLGFAYLDRILEEGWNIPVSLKLPNPTSFVHSVLV